MSFRYEVVCEVIILQAVYEQAPNVKIHATSFSMIILNGCKNILKLKGWRSRISAAHSSSSLLCSSGVKGSNRVVFLPYGSNLPSDGAYRILRETLHPLPEIRRSVSGSARITKTRIHEVSMTRNQKMKRNPRWPSSKPPITGPMAMLVWRTVKVQSVQGYDQRCTMITNLQKTDRGSHPFLLGMQGPR